MVKVFKGTLNEFYMDGYLRDNMDIAKKYIVQDWDMLFLYDGFEGSGKSVKATQDAFYCDPTLTLDRIVFTPYQFRKAVMSANKYEAIVYDEAYTGLSSRATMSLINRTLVSMLAEIRQKNLFVFIVMPTFFDLDKYVALWRSRALIHVYTKGGFERGYFLFFNTEKKKNLYIHGKKFYNYSCVKANFFGSFRNHYVVDEKEYRAKKKKSLLDREKKAEEVEIKRRFDEMLFDRLQTLKLNLTNSVKADIMCMTTRNYYRRLKDYDEMKDIDSI